MMKKKFVTVLSIVFVMAFAVAVYAFNQTNGAVKASASNCAMKDNCPLKGKNAQNAEAVKGDSCCSKEDCCCKSGSCPMKANGEKSADCCDNCCGGSCPMKEKQTTAVAAQTENEKTSHETNGV